MFGKNEVTKPFPSEDGSLLVVGDPWYTLQGEGPQAGWPAIFLRLAKCNLRCFFCDTYFEHGARLDLEYLSKVIQTMAHERKCSLVVITGGEPLLQNVVPLIKRLNHHSIRVSIETAGTAYVDGLDHLFAPWRPNEQNMIVCSPKTPVINARLRPLIGAFKYILRSGEADPLDGLPAMSTQIKDHLANIFRQDPNGVQAVPIYLQAMDEQDPVKNEKNLHLVTEMCLRYGYRQSIQTHKIVGVP